jgi:hypothetical protein
MKRSAVSCKPLCLAVSGAKLHFMRSSDGVKLLVVCTVCRVRRSDYRLVLFGPFLYDLDPERGCL